MNNNNNHSIAGSNRQAYYALAVLLLAYILSFIDRNVMAVLIGPIRDDFRISDFQFSLLHGFAFSMFYILLGLPIARLADHRNRKWIITLGVGLWSFMTCLCGMARSFSSLFLTRIGVGVGEAALSPPAFSLLADLFTPTQLPRAMAVFSLGITLGGGLAYIAGSAVHSFFVTHGVPDISLLSDVRPWQMTFFIVGAPGLIIVLLLLLMKEPARREIGSTAGQPALADVMAQLRSHRRAYLGLMGSMSLLAILGYGTMAWYPEFLIRSFGMERAAAGGQFGLIFLVAGSLGTLAGGWSVEPLARRGYRDAPLRLVLIAGCLWLLPGSLGPLSGSAEMAVWAACPIVFLLNSYYGVGAAGLQLITPNRMRAQISALMLFMTNLFGLALGPSAVALFTDFLFVDDLALRYSLALLPVVICPLAVALAWQGLGGYRRALEAA